jgi:hypothetical protein
MGANRLQYRRRHLRGREERARPHARRRPSGRRSLSPRPQRRETGGPLPRHPGTHSLQQGASRQQLAALLRPPRLRRHRPGHARALSIGRRMAHVDRRCRRRLRHRRLDRAPALERRRLRHPRDLLLRRHTARPRALQSARPEGHDPRRRRRQRRLLRYALRRRLRAALLQLDLHGGRRRQQPRPSGPAHQSGAGRRLPQRAAVPPQPAPAQGHDPAPARARL